MIIDKLKVLREMEILNELRKLIDKQPELAKEILVDIIEKHQLILNRFENGEK